MSNASRRVMAANPRLDSLRKILTQERASGYQDATVIGGLDRFLQHWAKELEPVLRGAGSYSILTPLQREEWARTVGPRLSADGEDAPKPSRPARPRAPRRVPPVPLDAAVSDLKGVARQTLPKLKRLGLQKVEDLVFHFPHRHNDFAEVSKVSELKLGEDQTVIVSVWEASETRQGHRRRSTQAVLGDDTGNVRAIWFNQPYLASTFKPGTSLVISGKVNVFRGSFVFESPDYEILRGQEELVHTGRLVPVYPTVEGLPQRTIRRIIKRALDSSLSQVVDFLPEDTRHRGGLMNLPNAIAQAHYPDGEADWASARRRLAFDELFLLQLAVVRRKKEWQQEDQGIPLDAGASSAVGEFLEALPFNLTGAQSRVLSEIMADLSQSRPMSRLLQGDVGSGKTVVAAAALLLAVVNGRQGALVAPTEILAEQHFLTLVELLSRRNGGDGHPSSASFEVHGMGRPLTVGLLVGSMTRKAKNEMHARNPGRGNRRRGGHPRAAPGRGRHPWAGRRGRGRAAPLRGDAARVDAREGRQAPPARHVGDAHSPVAGADAVRRARYLDDRRDARGPAENPHPLAGARQPVDRLRLHRQAGRAGPAGLRRLPADRGLRGRAGPRRHRGVRAAVRERVPRAPVGAAARAHGAAREGGGDGGFKAGDVQVLVATPVVEVGIDIPNASVMLVDGADRFGLAQLHQLRGRVGRGMHESYCILLADSPGQDARERLKLVERSGDGFELAEEDLRLRGPGDYLGTRQSGLPSLKVARVTDQDILAAGACRGRQDSRLRPGARGRAKRAARRAARQGDRRPPRRDQLTPAGPSRLP